MSFGQVMGHGRIKAILQEALLKDRLANAYLFAGPEGVGKGLMARQLAKAANCLEERGDSCDRCLSCRKIEQSNHPDVQVVVPEGRSILIGQVRELQRKLYLRPYEGRRRVIIMEQADTMTGNAMNSMLKSLEEPKEDTTFLLIACRPHQLPATIHSRCQILRFGPVALEDLVGEVMARTGVGREEAVMAAHLSRGRLGMALEAVEPTRVEQRRVFLREVLALPGAPLRQALFLAEGLGKDRQEALDRLGWLRELLRDGLVYGATGEMERVHNADLAEGVRALAGTPRGGEAFVELFDILSRAEEAIGASGNVQLWLERLMIGVRDLRA